MNHTARHTKPVFVNCFPLASGPQNVPDAIQCSPVTYLWTTPTAFLGRFGQMLLHSAPQLAWHPKKVDIIGFCDTISLQGVSSLLMGLVTTFIAGYAFLLKLADF
jgi:hypothetical protein